MNLYHLTKIFIIFSQSHKIWMGVDDEQSEEEGKKNELDEEGEVEKDD